MKNLWEMYNNFANRRELVRITSNTTHIPAAIIFTIILITAVVLLLVGIWTLIISLFMFYVYPAYMTFKALKSGKPELLLRFGKFWVVFGFTVFIYRLTEWLLLSIPFLGLLKCFFAYLMIRNNAAGGVFLYDMIFQPTLGRYELLIDDKLEAMQVEVERGKK